jgi:N6-adenosine-specific RNA methylase IME4
VTAAINIDFRTMTAADVALHRPHGGWRVIFADPAWPALGNSKEKPGKSAGGHYELMKVAEMEAMPVKTMAADDALLCMWVTVPYAEHGFRLARSWGFAYKTQLTWPKGRIAHGYWARNAHEMLYICRRGKFPCEMPALFPTSVIPTKRRAHSRKPEWPQCQVEARFPDIPKLELFARAPRAGWTVMGNEVNKFSEDQSNAEMP